MSAHFSTRPTSSTLSTAAAHVAAVAVESLGTMVEFVLDWQDRRRQRRELLALDDHLLKDIGVTRLEAEIEAHKPFWRN